MFRLFADLRSDTSIFSALNSVLYRPLPGADAGSLLMLRRGESASFSYPDVQDMQARTRLWPGLTASFPMESDLEVDGVGEFVAAEVVAAYRVSDRTRAARLAGT